MVGCPIPEVWKDIKDYEGYYQVSNFGQVKSLNRIIIYSDGRKMPIRERILKHRNHTQGYLNVLLTRDNISQEKTVYRIVMKAFKGENKLYVNHINGNKTDNRLINLEHTTHLENINHSVRVLKNKKRYGVRKRCGKWSAVISLKGRNKWLGTFVTEERAYQVFYNAYL